jgi:predicted O-linked N-acetylglucosamine transferase (SPINDLY family)
MASKQFRIWWLGKEIERTISKIRLGYICHDLRENSVSGICTKLKKDVML